MGKAIILPPGYAETYLPPGMSGSAIAPDQYWRNLWRKTWVDSSLYAVIRDIEKMDGPDGDPRVKKIHTTTAQYLASGGLTLFGAENSPNIQRAWQRFHKRVGLHILGKTFSDARQFLLSGNLPLEVVTQGNEITALLALPAATVVPHTDDRGRISDPKKAYSQYDLANGIKQAEFSLGNLLLARYSPRNYDDKGAMGRPMLDSSRETWKRLTFAEKKLVERRASRASLRLAHVMEGATLEELNAYKLQIEADQYSGHDRDYYMNKKGAIQPISGDAQLSDIGDILHLMNIFFAAAPAPPGLFGWGQELSRDVLQELMAHFYAEVDTMQEMLATVYQEAFEIQLALSGIDPRAYDFEVEYIEPNTMSKAQRSDWALKLQALGMPRQTIIRAAGFSPADIQDLIKAEQSNPEAYAPASAIQTNTGQVQPKVTITPLAAGRGQSRTDISQ